MAIKTAVLGLNKAEPRDLVKTTLITYFNENWDKIDSAFGSHLNDSDIHVVKDGTIQTGLNAEMVGGFKAEDLAPAQHDHDDKYYTKEEIDAIIALRLSEQERPVYSIRPSLADVALLFAGQDRTVALTAAALSKGDTIYGGLKIVTADELNMTFMPLYRSETEDLIRMVFVFSFDDTSNLSGASQIAVRFSESGAADHYKVTYQPQSGDVMIESTVDKGGVVDSTSIGPAATRTVQTAVDEMNSAFPLFGPAYCIDVKYSPSAATVCIKSITDIRSAYDTEDSDCVAILYRKDITFQELRPLNQFCRCGLQMLEMSDVMLHMLDITTYSRYV